MPLHPDFTRSYDSLEGSKTCWLPLTDKGFLCRATADGSGIALLEETPALAKLFPAASTIPLGTLNGVVYKACELPLDLISHPEFEGCSCVDLRKFYGAASNEETLIAGYAAQILHWIRTSNFCPICGGTMSNPGKEWMRKCSSCGHERYPHVCPALLILVHDGADGILMAHKPGWGNRYSIFAGFVLPGESLEECVHREVDEEAGVVVGELAYAGSQPWPYPQQLMIGFRARYLGGEIQIDEEELDDSRWFQVDALPELPGWQSLSRQMIEAWREERLTLRKV